MRKSLFVVCLLLVFALIAQAQDKPKVEVFGGYSYLRADDNDDGINLHGWNASGTYNFNKWIGVKGDFSGHYGQYTLIPPSLLTPPLDTHIKGDLNTYLFLVGPQFAYREHDVVTPFGHVLVGAAHRSTEATGDAALRLRTAGIDPDALPFNTSDTSFAFVAGGGLDVKITKYLAWRAFQADYVLTTFDDQVFVANPRTGAVGPLTDPRDPTRIYCGLSGFASFIDGKPGQSSCSDRQHNFRFSTGLVLRLGDH